MDGTTLWFHWMGVLYLPIGIFGTLIIWFVSGWQAEQSWPCKRNPWWWIAIGILWTWPFWILMWLIGFAVTLNVLMR